jgi:hypothetical protein
MAILCKYLIASIFPIAALAAPLVQRDMITDIVTEIVWAATAAPEEFCASQDHFVVFHAVGWRHGFLAGKGQALVK